MAVILNGSTGGIQLTSSAGGTMSVNPPATSTSYVQTLPAATGTILNSESAVAAAKLTGAGFLKNKNKIINGNMLIAQRGTTGTAGAGGSYLACDRWKAWEASDGAATVSQAADGPTGQFKNCLKYNITTADSSITASQFGMVRQMIEGHNIIDLGFGTASAQSVTISFWVKSSLTGSHGAALNNGNEDRSYPFAYTVSSANTWEYKTVTIAGDTSGTWDTDSTAGMIITFGLGTGTTYQGTADAWQAGNKFQPSGTIQNIGTVSNWNVTGVQLEAGTTATSFENLSYTDQYTLCQRYYQKYLNDSGAGGEGFWGTGLHDSTTSFVGGFTFQTPMRIKPTAFETTGTATDYRVQIKANGSVTCSSVPTVTGMTTWGARLVFTTASGLNPGEAGLYRSNTTAAYVAWSAEL